MPRRTLLVSAVEESELVIDPREFGAVGDGVTDDSAAFQAAIDAASTATVRTTVFMPQGVYRINTKLVISKGGVSLRGYSGFYRQGDLGVGCCLLQGSNGMTVLEVSDNGSGVFIENCELSDFAIQGNGNSNSENVGVYAYNIHNSEFRNIHVSSMLGGIGVKIRDETYQLSLHSCQSYLNATGFQILGGIKGNNTNADGINFYNCHGAGNSSDNLFIAAGNTTFNDWGGKYEGTGVQGGTASDYNIRITGGMTEVNLHNTYMEQGTIADLEVYKSASTGSSTARDNASTAVGARCLNIWGGIFHGNGVGKVAINGRGLNRLNAIGIHTEQHTGTGTGGIADTTYGVADPSPININDTGLTNALNTNCLLVNPRLNETAGFANSVSTSVAADSGTPLTVLNYANSSDNEAYWVYVSGGGGFRRPYTITQAWSPGSIANDAVATTTVGIASGGGSVSAGTESSVTVGYTGLTVVGWILSGYLIDATTVAVLLQNKTGGPITPTGTLRVELWRH